MKHKSLVVYVPFSDGGCEDIGRIELDGHTLVSDKRLWELEAAEKHADELASLERYRTAYNEWVDKTEWVQADTSLPAKYLGMHRADVLKDKISELFSRLEAAEKELVELRLGISKQQLLTDAAQQLAEAAQRRADKLSARAESAETERDALRTELNEVRYGVAVAHDTIKALRAKVEAMEQQEPVAWLHETRRDSDVVTDAVKHVWGKAAVGSMAAYSIPLYALPGAQGEEK